MYTGYNFKKMVGLKLFIVISLISGFLQLFLGKVNLLGFFCDKDRRKLLAYGSVTSENAEKQ